MGIGSKTIHLEPKQVAVVYLHELFAEGFCQVHKYFLFHLFLSLLRPCGHLRLQGMEVDAVEMEVDEEWDSESTWGNSPESRRGSRKER